MLMSPPKTCQSGGSSSRLVRLRSRPTHVTRGSRVIFQPRRNRGQLRGFRLVFRFPSTTGKENCGCSDRIGSYTCRERSRYSRSEAWMRMTVVFEMNLPFAVKRDGRWFVSCCPPLDVCTQGPTAKKAVANLVDALQLFLLSCYERGTLDQVLKKSGFRPRLPRRPGK